MTDKEQIEAMAKTLSEYEINELTVEKDLAEFLYNAGYRKVSEGDIIITEDENFENLKHIATCVRKLKTKIRKETAKEIFDEILYSCEKLGSVVNWRELIVSKAFLKEFAEKYGVEIK